MCFYLSQLQYSKTNKFLHSTLQRSQDRCLSEFAQSEPHVDLNLMDVAALFCYLVSAICQLWHGVLSCRAAIVCKISAPTDVGWALGYLL